MDSQTLSDKKANSGYIVAVILMLLFIFSDLLFDFAFTFEASDFIAFGFTLLSAVIVFYCNGKIRNDEYRNKYYTTSNFIKSNFDNAQVIFSILDIVCGLISVLSTLFFLSYAFKVVRIFYIPAKVLVVLNKEKSLLKPIAKFSFFWTSMRVLERRGGSMKNFIKSNKFTISFGLLISAFCGVLSYKVLPTFVATLPVWACIAIAVGIGCVVFGLVFFLGRDTVEGLALRFAKKVLPEDKYAELLNTYNNAVAEVAKAEAEAKEAKAKEAEEAKVKKEAEKRAEKPKKEKVDKKAVKAAKKKQKEEEKAKAKAEFEAKVQAELDKIKAEKTEKVEA